MPVPSRIKKNRKETGSVSQSDLFGLVGYNIKRAYMYMHRDFKATLDELALTQRTFSVLSIVVANPDISQSAVTAALAIERSGTVVIVDELEGRDLIQREKVPGDRRAYALRATLKGHDFYAKDLAAVHRHEERVLGSMNSEERQTLITLLQRVQNEED